MIRCNKCDAEMFSATMKQQFPAELPIYLSNKKQGLLESEKRSDILCYVCPECGLIELHAKDPKALRI